VASSAVVIHAGEHGSRAPAASWTAATLPAQLWSQTAIMARPSASAASTMAGGVISASAQGDNAVRTCRSAKQTFTHGSSPSA
jgi:hypothetical protein